MYEQILYEVAEPVATITLNRPQSLNAWTPQMDQEVQDAFRRAEEDTRVVGIILTGAGKAFCAGADLKGLEAVSEGGFSEAAIAGERPGDSKAHDGFRFHYSYIASICKPVIAAIHGACAGMALPISTFCDLRFASDKSVFLSAFSQRGLVAEWGSSWMLPRLVGMANAMDILLSSRKIFADEALQMGLVNRVVSPEQLTKEAEQYIVNLAENCSPRSMAVMKRQLYDQWQADLEAALQQSMEQMKSSFESDDFKEGVSSFLGKRKPAFARLSGPPRT